MPGMGKSKYYWMRYEELRERGYSKSESASVAAEIEKRHIAKRKRNARRRS